MRFAQRLSISHAGISFARKRSKTHRKPFKGYEYMVVSMVGFSNFPSPAVNYPVMCTPVFESQVFFDAFEECTKLSVFFFDIIGFLRWQADFKSDDLNPTVIRLKIGQLAMDSVEDTDIAPKAHSLIGVNSLIFVSWFVRCFQSNFPFGLCLLLGQFGWSKKSADLSHI